MGTQRPNHRRRAGQAEGGRQAEARQINEYFLSTPAAAPSMFPHNLLYTAKNALTHPVTWTWGMMTHLGGHRECGISIRHLARIID